MILILLFLFLTKYNLTYFWTGSSRNVLIAFTFLLMFFITSVDRTGTSDLLLYLTCSSSSRYRLTRIVVDNEAGPNKNHTVVFLGSEKGIILKFLAKMNNGFLNHSLFLEELSVYNPLRYVGCTCVWDKLTGTKIQFDAINDQINSVVACLRLERVCVFPSISLLSQPTNPPAPSVPQPKLHGEASQPDGYSII